MSDDKRIFVESEFAPLKRVIVARSEFAFPDQPLSEEEMAFLTPEARELFSLDGGGEHRELYPERQKAWEAERENFKQLLARYGVEVLEPRLLTEVEKQFSGTNGYSNFFVRDPIFTVGDFVIEGSMRFLHRRQEVLPVRPIISQHVMDSLCHYVAIPQPELFDPADHEFDYGPYLEGGDVLVLGKHVFVGSSGLASNVYGKFWLEKLLAPHGYQVEFVPLKPTILHLDCALSLVKPGLMVVCESVFLNGIPDTLKDWDRINIAEEDCTQLAANGMPINEQVYVMDPFFSRIGDELAKRGMKIECIDFSISRAFGGSFRCSTQPLLRCHEIK